MPGRAGRCCGISRTVNLVWADVPREPSRFVGGSQTDGGDPVSGTSNQTSDGEDVRFGCQQVTRREYPEVVWLLSASVWCTRSACFAGVSVVSFTRRLRQIDRMELEAAAFKQTEEYKNFERQAAARDRGIMPEHRRTLQNNSANTNISPPPLPFRPNVYDRYRMQRRRG